jgi:hypothetical protein
MEHTSCGHKCPFVKTGFCKDETECPNYIESWWVEDKTQETKLVKDCVPKRMMLQINQLQSVVTSAQAASEEARNETLLMKGHFHQLVEQSKQVIRDQEAIQLQNNRVLQIPKQ